MLLFIPRIVVVSSIPEHRDTIIISDKAARKTKRNGIIALVVFFLLAMPAQLSAFPTTTSCNTEQAFASVDRQLKNKHYEEARAALNSLRSCPGLSNIEKFNLGWLYGRSRDFHTALTIFNSLPADVPDPSTHQYAIALGQFELSDYKGAVETLKATLQQGALDSRSANLLGVSYSKLGLYQEAYPVLAEELRRDPNDLLAYLNLVALFADSNDYENAAKVATRATSVFPENPDVFVVLGAADTLRGDYNKAHDDLEKAIRLSPHLAQPRFLLAVSDYKKRDFAKAEAEIKEALDSGIDNSDLHYLLAECLFELDSTKDQAILSELGRAIALNPRNVSARTMRGRMLLDQHRAQEAVADLELAHQVDPDSHSTTYVLARAYAAVGRKDEAKGLFSSLSGQVSQDLKNQRSMEITDALNERKLKQILSGEH
jgi:tetratricopeptide (TPR) repeat protein